MIMTELDLTSLHGRTDLIRRAQDARTKAVALLESDAKVVLGIGWPYFDTKVEQDRRALLGTVLTGAFGVVITSALVLVVVFAFVAGFDIVVSQRDVPVPLWAKLLFIAFGLAILGMSALLLFVSIGMLTLPAVQRVLNGYGPDLPQRVTWAAGALLSAHDDVIIAINDGKTRRIQYDAIADVLLQPTEGGYNVVLIDRLGNATSEMSNVAPKAAESFRDTVLARLPAMD